MKKKFFLVVLIVVGLLFLGCRTCPPDANVCGGVCPLMCSGPQQSGLSVFDISCWCN